MYENIPQPTTKEWNAYNNKVVWFLSDWQKEIILSGNIHGWWKYKFNVAFLEAMLPFSIDKILNAHAI